MKPYRTTLAKAVREYPAGHPVHVIGHLGKRGKLVRVKRAGLKPAYFVANHDEVHPRDVGPDRLTRKPKTVEEPPATIYVSPSVREGSTLQHATAGFGNNDHARQIQDAAKLGGKNVRPAVGVWSDGAEESTTVEAPVVKARILAAALGHRANQKAVMTFAPRKGGPSLRFVLKYPAADFHRVVSTFADEGVPFHTHFPDARVMGTAGESHSVVEKAQADAGLTEAIHRAAGKLGAQVRAEEGDAEFIGDDDRLKARKIFQEILAQAVMNKGSQGS